MYIVQIQLCGREGNLWLQDFLFNDVCRTFSQWPSATPAAWTAFLGSPFLDYFFHGGVDNLVIVICLICSQLVACITPGLDYSDCQLDASWSWCRRLSVICWLNLISMAGKDTGILEISFFLWCALWIRNSASLPKYSLTTLRPAHANCKMKSSYWLFWDEAMVLLQPLNFYYSELLEN